MDLTQAIEERRARIAQLQAELEQLEMAAQLVSKVLAGAPMNGSVKPPPPRAKAAKQRKGRPVPSRVSSPAAVPASRDCLGCKKPLPPRPKGQAGRPKQFHPECKPSAAGRSPSTKAEPDPAPMDQVAWLGRQQKLKAAARAPVSVPAPAPVAPKANGLMLNGEERERLLREAQKWKGQCSAVNERGQRCGLLYPHEGAHNASGRPFTTSVSAGSALPRRELDERATSGSGR